MKTLSVFILLISSVGLALAYSHGPLDGYANNPPAQQNCATCHISFPVNSGDGSFLFTDMPEDGYVPGETYDLVLSISDDGQSRWGFELTAQKDDNSMAGQLIITDPNRTQLSTLSGITYLKQTSNGTSGDGSSSSWIFSWTAPEAGAGPITFYASGNAADNDASVFGDYVYTIGLTLSEIISGQPVILLSATEYDFGPVLTGESRFWDLDVTNDGNLDLSLSSVTTSGDVFLVEDVGATTIGAGQMTTIELSFNPETIGMVEDSLVIESNDPNSPRSVVYLSGNGVLPQPPNAFDLVSPMDESMVTEELQTFFWRQTMDPDPGAQVVSYLFQWTTDESFSTYDEASSEIDTFFVIDTNSLDTDVVYYWRVLATDTNTDGTLSSETWSFTVEGANSVVDQGFGIPKEFGIAKAYPNPFNSTVNVRLAVPQLATVQVSVYDIMGREVANLNQGVLTAGTHELSWHATGSAGIYFVRASTSNGQSAIQKLMFVK